jgi:hypothetical protein
MALGALKNTFVGQYCDIFWPQFFHGVFCTGAQVSRGAQIFLIDFVLVKLFSKSIL